MRHTLYMSALNIHDAVGGIGPETGTGPRPGAGTGKGTGVSDRVG